MMLIDVLRPPFLPMGSTHAAVLRAPCCRAPLMLIDVLTDRGFSVSHTAEVSYVPVSVDLATGAIKSRKDTKHRCRGSRWAPLRARAPCQAHVPRARHGRAVG